MQHKDRIWTLMSRKLSGVASAAELIELNDLIKGHPDADVPVQFIHNFWALPTETDDDFLEATFHLHNQRLKEKGFDLELDKHETGSLNIEAPVNRKRKWVLMGSAVAVIVIIVFFSFFYTTTNSKGIVADSKIAHSEVSTKNGSRTKIQLPDGSSVWLNSSSKLTYNNNNFGVAVREVTLTGEAYFDVVKNPLKPFIIHTEKMDIKVLGTAFNVKCYPGEKNSETSLIRGSIEVTLKDRQEKIMMKPSEKLILNNDEVKSAKISTPSQKATPARPVPIIELSHLTFYPTDNSIVETGWVENRLVFTGETLEDIAVKMERWYGVNIVIANEKLKKELLTGIFEKETIYQALTALQLTTPFTYKVDKNVITISK
ncbi:FecR family protein [Ferruginibacter sp.]|nr:FecR family protein [Ferruginibacter sp.]